MKQNKQTKIVAILAIFISVLGLTLGFAAFSNTLTISSSAIVSPNEADFNINVYGIAESPETLDMPSLQLYTSPSISVPLRGYNGALPAKSATTAKIIENGKSITISDINAELSEPYQTATYFFMIKNEGKYDAYLDLTDYIDNPDDGIYFDFSQNGICTPGEGTTPAYVNNVCNVIILSRTLIDSSGAYRNGGDYIKIARGDYLILQMSIEYYLESIQRADGDFSVAFKDFTLEFTSVPPAE